VYACSRPTWDLRRDASPRKIVKDLLGRRRARYQDYVSLEARLTQRNPQTVRNVRYSYATTPLRLWFSMSPFRSRGVQFADRRHRPCPVSVRGVEEKLIWMTRRELSWSLAEAACTSSRFLASGRTRRTDDGSDWVVVA
jgi:hypothetical protein